MIKGYSKQASNKEYFKSLGINENKLKANSTFTSLPIAIGTHIGDFSDEDSNLYTEAIIYGLENGINFIDTALNYRGMRSERDIAKALDVLINQKKTLKREEIIISTKAGIIPGDIVLNIRPNEYLEKILLGNGILEEKDINTAPCCKHVLNPKYYEYAIELSKEHLGIETIDIHYIHNPEHSKEVIGEEAFYKKLEALFSFYEGQVEKGNIKHYGFATWDALLANQEEDVYISLEKTLQVAKIIAGDKHHFEFVQMPYSLSKTSAISKQNQPINGKLLSPIKAAKELGLNVTISAPLAQGEGLNTSFTAGEALKHVTKTEGVFATMVGMKRINHVKDNLSYFL